MATTFGSLSRDPQIPQLIESVDALRKSLEAAANDAKEAQARGERLTRTMGYLAVLTGFLAVVQLLIAYVDVFILR